jgi:hypothetical protein
MGNIAVMKPLGVVELENGDKSRCKRQRTAHNSRTDNGGGGGRGEKGVRIFSIVLMELEI